MPKIYTEDEELLLHAGIKRLKSRRRMVCALVALMHNEGSEPKVLVLFRPAQRFKSPEKLKPIVTRLKRDLRQERIQVIASKAVFGYATYDGRHITMEVTSGDPTRIRALHREMKKLAKQYGIRLLRKFRLEVEGELQLDPDDSVELEPDPPTPVPDVEIDIDEERLAKLEAREEARLRAGIGAMTDAMIRTLGADALDRRMALLDEAFGSRLLASIATFNEAIDEVSDQLDDLRDLLLDLASRRDDSELRRMALHGLSDVSRQHVFRHIDALLTELETARGGDLSETEAPLRQLDETLDTLLDEIARDPRVTACDAGLFPTVTVRIGSTLNQAARPLRHTIQRLLSSL